MFGSLGVRGRRTGDAQVGLASAVHDARMSGVVERDAALRARRGRVVPVSVVLLGG